LSEMLAAALAQPSPEARERYLDTACGRDKELRDQLDSLLKAHDRAGDFLRPSASKLGGNGANGANSAEGLGTMIGRYRLLQQIGEGGFGLVFMAEQQEPVRRMVALKILKAGMDSREVIARFEAERQALALMDHPNIARVLDGGTTPSGRPYFVMDLVKGIPLTEFCEQQQLPIEARLRLFMKVCAGVQHAHQKGVIHRDLKPTNILVTLHDGEPVPKVIDFGIAKAIGQKLTERTLFTRFEQLIGTPAYMSPEQAEWSGLDVDTRSDLYSLGVLLYELLTGTTPLRKETLARAALDEVRRMIREAEPPKPSTRLTAILTTGEVRLPPNSEAQKSEAGDWQEPRPTRVDSACLRQRLQAVRGDLDWIAMKALDKDRARRYETANGLARDVERHLNGEPVVACPPSKGYRAGKFIRRHRLAVGATAGIVLALVVGLASALVGFAQARRANRKAQEEAAEANAVRDFLLHDLIEQGDPNLNTNRDLTLHELLDRASERLKDRFTNQPLVEASLRQTLAETYKGLQEYDRVESNVLRAVEIRTRLLGPDHPDTIESMTWMVARGYGPARNSKEQERLLKQLVQTCRRIWGADGTNTLVCQECLADYYVETGRSEEGERLLRDVLDREKRVLGPVDHNTLLAMNELGALYSNRGQHGEAASLAEEGLRLSRQALGPAHPQTLLFLSNLARARDALGDVQSATELYRESIKLRRRIFGPSKTNPDFKEDLQNLGELDGVMGRWPECVEVCREWFTLTNHAEFHNIGGAVSRGSAAALLAGDTNAYREFAQQMIARSADTNSAAWAPSVCQVCLLMPGPDLELEPVFKLAERIKADQPALCPEKIAKGMAAYRQGNMVEALKQFQGWRRCGRSSEAAQAGYFCAMIHHREGDSAAAHADLDEAARRLAIFVKTGLREETWYKYGYIAAARTEAERMILGRQVTSCLDAAWLESARTQWQPVKRHLSLAGDQVRQRKWSEARDQFVTALHDPDFDWEALLNLDDYLTTQIGVTFLLAKDLQEHERFYRSLFAHFEEYPDGKWIYHALKACLVREFEPTDELGQEALKWCQTLDHDHGTITPEGIGMIGAMAAYRAGRYQEAIEQCKAADKSSLGIRGLARIFRAMALARSGRWGEGKQALEQAETDLGDHVRTLEGDHWWDLALCQVALDEAHRLFDGAH